MTSLPVVIVCIDVTIQKWETEKIISSGFEEVIYGERACATSSTKLRNGIPINL